MLSRRDRFDYIIIETTGLANPGPVAASLWTDAELECGVQLDGIITVVDARNVQRQLDEHRPEGRGAEEDGALSDVELTEAQRGWHARTMEGQQAREGYQTLFPAL